ncbi:MAG: nickel pincer cofactor biosynthesis protein LarC [Proteobacteria bacterium]|nr:nickel pincer cofactor biosynthesis protein LarC [Pseudomonadota bacterium]MCP4920865.1 nickel pincer cofactor biosynthesis protein LarC [Pseudomonadota bacterium]
MSTLWIDATNGIAGDMFCAALLDAGGDLDALRAAIAPLVDVELSTSTVRRHGFAAVKFNVGFQAGDHDHVHWSGLRERIEHAGLPERVTRRALAAFGLLARAEARVHGTTVEQVAFHEVGAADSIADMVGACVLLEQLGVDEVVCTALPAGSGTVQTQHGPLDVPAPATIGVLAGWPMVQDGRPGELVTPTGAALVAALATFGPMPSMRIAGQGRGAGTRDPDAWSNTVRVVLGERVDAPSPRTVQVIEAQVDDMTGEHLPPLFDALFAAGAIDAYATPILMKKGRSGLLITALATDAEPVETALLTHSSTFGVRTRQAERRVLDRRHVEVNTRFGAVRVKLGSEAGELLHASPELVDCAARAREHGVSVARVQAAAVAALEEDGWP